MRRDAIGLDPDLTGWAAAFIAARLAVDAHDRPDLDARERAWIVCCALGVRDAETLRAACELPWDG